MYTDPAADLEIGNHAPSRCMDSVQRSPSFSRVKGVFNKAPPQKRHKNANPSARPGDDAALAGAGKIVARPQGRHGAAKSLGSIFGLDLQG